MRSGQRSRRARAPGASTGEVPTARARTDAGGAGARSNRRRGEVRAGEGFLPTGWRQARAPSARVRTRPPSAPRWSAPATIAGLSSGAGRSGWPRSRSRATCSRSRTRAARTTPDARARASIAGGFASVRAVQASRKPRDHVDVFSSSGATGPSQAAPWRASSSLTLRVGFGRTVVHDSAMNSPYARWVSSSCCCNQSA